MPRRETLANLLRACAKVVFGEGAEVSTEARTRLIKACKAIAGLELGREQGRVHLLWLLDYRYEHIERFLQKKPHLSAKDLFNDYLLLELDEIATDVDANPPAKPVYRDDIRKQRQANIRGANRDARKNLLKILEEKYKDPKEMDKLLSEHDELLMKLKRPYYTSEK